MLRLTVAVASVCLLAAADLVPQDSTQEGPATLSPPVPEICTAPASAVIVRPAPEPPSS